MSEEWYRAQVSKLRSDDNRMDALNEIHSKLSQMTVSEGASCTFSFLASPEIFECLKNSKESEEQSLALEILSICMCNLNVDDTNISNLMSQAIRCSNIKVQSLALNELQRVFRLNPEKAILDDQLTLATMHCLDSPESSVGGMATKVLSLVLVHNFHHQEIRSQLLDRLNGSDVVRCRVYEICVHLAKTSYEMSQNVLTVLDRMVDELKSDDILIMLNILEMLTSLAEQNHGLIYLENKKVFEEISSTIEGINQNPMKLFLIPGFLKFFGKTASVQPQRIITGYPKFVDFLIECLLSRDLSILPIAFDTLANVAHSMNGKILLNEHYTERIKEVFEEIGINLRNLPTELKVRCFDALLFIFETNSPSEEVSNIAKFWYKQLAGANDFTFLLGYCTNPFPEIKIACLNFVKSLCDYPWGLLAMRRTAGFIEYLLDRRTEFDKDALHTKYEIIAKLANTTVFDANTLLQFKKYLSDGVLYVQGVVEIAVEGL